MQFDPSQLIPDTFDAICSLLDFETQLSLRRTCTRIRKLVESNKLFVDRLDLCKAYEVGRFYEMAKITIRRPDFEVRITHAYRLFRSKKRYEKSKNHEEIVIVHHFTYLSESLNPFGLRDICYRFVLAMSLLGDYDHIESTMEIFRANMKGCWNVAMYGVAFRGNGGLFHRLESRHKRDDTLPPLNWNMIFIGAVRGGDRNLVRYCYDTGKVETNFLFLHFRYYDAIRTGNVSFVRFYDEFIYDEELDKSVVSPLRFRSWEILEKEDIPNREEIISYLWNREKFCTGDFSTWRRLYKYSTLESVTGRLLFDIRKRQAKMRPKISSIFIHE